MSFPLHSVTIHQEFFRHERWYCFFSLNGRPDEFLYYSHKERPLRSLMFGKNFSGSLPNLLERDDLCIECGLGLLISGGVALDDGDLIAWNCTVEEANDIMTALRESCTDRKQHIVPFEERSGAAP